MQEREKVEDEALCVFLSRVAQKMKETGVVEYKYLKCGHDRVRESDTTMFVGHDIGHGGGGGRVN